LKHGEVGFAEYRYTALNPLDDRFDFCRLTLLNLSMLYKEIPEEKNDNLGKFEAHGTDRRKNMIDLIFAEKERAFFGVYKCNDENEGKNHCY